MLSKYQGVVYEYLVFIILGCAFFRNFTTHLPIINYSDKLLIISTIVAIILFVGRRINQIFSWTFLPFIFFIFITVVSAVFGVDKVNSFLEIRFLLTGFLVYTFFALNKPNGKKLEKIVVILSFFNLAVILFSGFSIIAPRFALRILNIFFDDSTLTLYNYDFLRKRIIPIGAIYITFLLPLPLFLRFIKKNLIWLYYLSLVFFGIFAIIVSNYRSAFIVVVCGLILALLALRSKLKYIIISATTIIVLFSNLISSNLFDVSVLDRFTLKNDFDSNTINSRLEYIFQAIEIAKQRPVLGVGLGNYDSVADPIIVTVNSEDNLGVGKSLPSGVSDPGLMPLDLSRPAPQEEIRSNAHNQFFSYLAETGALGAAAYLFLIMVFFWRDTEFISKSKLKADDKNLILFLIIASWMYIVGSWLDAWSNNLFYTFCLIRGIVESYYQKNI